jgi:FSR family fosmidomycin resistance protein-like MFS transporter
MGTDSQTFVGIVHPPSPGVASGDSKAERTALGILCALSFSHLLNDTIQSLIPAIYPILRESYALTYAQIGLITLTYQVTASLLQPLVGIYTDRRPQPYMLPIGMFLTLTGLVSLAMAGNLGAILFSAALVGMGSSFFHPEASRVAQLASGGKHGLAQSLFQVGGNFGTSLGPLLAAAIIVPQGQMSLAWFSVVALLGIGVLTKIGNWYRRRLDSARAAPRREHAHAEGPGFSRRQVILSLVILIVLIVSKYFYLVSLTNYYTFYLMYKFDVSVQLSQVYLFVFLFAVAAGTILGGPFGDRFGRRIVIWVSILGVAPFSLVLPHVGLTWVVLLTVVIGVVLASAFSAILVYAQELIPGKVGLISGLFFGFAFGVGGIASAALGKLADQMGIEYVFEVCAYLPLLGLLTGFLPKRPEAAR